MQIWVLRPANSRAQLVIWGLLNVSLAEQHQNLCDLRAACRRAWGQGIAGKEVHSDCPLHGGPCVCADSAAVRERIERSGLRDVIPLIFRIAIQNGNQLFQTERGVRCKFSVSDAVDNTGFRCPINSCAVPVRRQIRKVAFQRGRLLSMRQRIVTIIARVIAASGENVDALVPFIRPFSVT